MHRALTATMREAMRLTRTRLLDQATAAIQQALHGAPVLASHPKPAVKRKVDVPLCETTPQQNRYGMPAIPMGARYESAIFSGPAGSRDYRVYVPASYTGHKVPLVVMLHGCQQDADDFARGTRMNEAAEAAGCIVVYPEQALAANMSRCWNWFNAADQHAGRGEPSLIAGIIAQVIRDHRIDPSRIYVAGLSAGGAEAAIMGAAYPELFAAIGVHSGLPFGAASDMPSAFTAMRTGRGGMTPTSGVPTIVFHGDRDTTVHPSNGDQVIAQGGQGSDRERHEDGDVPGGHSYRRTLHMRGDTIHSEQWTIHGAGHSWSGGSPEGSYTDPRGPDASREMLRFFLAHRNQR